MPVEALQRQLLEDCLEARLEAGLPRVPSHPPGLAPARLSPCAGAEVEKSQSSGCTTTTEQVFLDGHDAAVHSAPANFHLAPIQAP